MTRGRQSVRRWRPMSSLVVALSTAGVVLGGCSRSAAEDVQPAKFTLIQWALSQRSSKLAGHAERVTRAMIHAEHTYHIDALLLLALAEQESTLNPKARGRGGSLGLMQLHPDTARAVAKQHGIDWRGPNSLFNPVTNVQIAAAYLAELKSHFKRWNLALTAYNNEPTRIRRWLRDGKRPPLSFASAVRQRYQRLRRAYDY